MSASYSQLSIPPEHQMSVSRILKIIPLNSSFFFFYPMSLSQILQFLDFSSQHHHFLQSYESEASIVDSSLFLLIIEDVQSVSCHVDSVSTNPFAFMFSINFHLYHTNSSSRYFPQPLQPPLIFLIFYLALPSFMAEKYIFPTVLVIPFSKFQIYKLVTKQVSRYS